MKKKIMILILCLSLVGCTAGGANNVHSAKTTVDNGEEWNSLFNCS